MQPAPAPPSPEPHVAADLDSAASGLALPPLDLARSRARLAAGGCDAELHVTVFGSSTTEGIGASSRAATFPAIMCREMLGTVPAIALSNRGIGGDNATDLHARLDQVIEDRPDLILFQTGSNDPLQEVALERFRALTEADLQHLAARTDADLVLIDQQFCRMLEECAAFPPFLTALHEVGQACRVPVFPRYRLMQSWAEMPGWSRDTLSPDGLHMGDGGYDLLGRALAGWLLGGLRSQAGPPAEAAGGFAASAGRTTVEG